MTRDLDEEWSEEPIGYLPAEMLSGDPRTPQAQVIDAAEVIARHGNRDLAIAVAAFAAELAVGA